VADTLDTIWQAEPHTFAKHRIITNYLDGWMHIMSHQAAKMRSQRDIVFVDGFAGPGVYAGGEDGSPVLAMKAAAEHDHDFPRPVNFLFIEQDAQRHASLRKRVEELMPSLQKTGRIGWVNVQQADCVPCLCGFMDECESQGKPFGPALVFLDQFGYSDVPMACIRKVMSRPECEVFAYLNYAGMSRFLGDDTKDDARTAAFGSNAWREARDLVGHAREQALLQIYKNALREHGGARYVWDFAMADANDRPLYWLFFATNNIRGLEVMKSAMWRVDESGTFRFADNMNPDQLLLLQVYDGEWLAGHLAERLSGQTLTVAQIKEYVLTETPCVNYARSMGRLVKNGQAERASGTGRIAFTKESGLPIRFL